MKLFNLRSDRSFHVGSVSKFCLGGSFPSSQIESRTSSAIKCWSGRRVLQLWLEFIAGCFINIQLEACIKAHFRAKSMPRDVFKGCREGRSAFLIATCCHLDVKLEIGQSTNDTIAMEQARKITLDLTATAVLTAISIRVLCTTPLPFFSIDQLEITSTLILVLTISFTLNISYFLSITSSFWCVHICYEGQNYRVPKSYNATLSTGLQFIYPWNHLQITAPSLSRPMAADIH